MRLGTVLVPAEAYGHLFVWGDTDVPVGVCALGSMLLGYGARPQRTWVHETNDDEVVENSSAFTYYGWASARLDAAGAVPRTCPACTCPTDEWEWDDVITHLNDIEGWSVAAVANWLAGVGM